MTEVFKGEQRTKMDCGKVKRWDKKETRGYVEMKKLQKRVNGELLNMVWQGGLGQCTTRSLAALNFLKMKHKG